MKPQKVPFGALFVVFLLGVLQGISKVFEVSSFSFVCNEQGPFSFVFPPVLLEVGGAIALLFFFWQWITETDRFKAWCWLFLLGAGLSNFWERLIFGCVKDFFTFFSLPTFNGADVVLSVSVVLLLWREFFSPLSRISNK